jgi:hypothetical protein
MLIKATGGEAGQYDQVAVGGNATLNGKLNLYTLDGYVPLANDGFVPLGYEQVSGSFASVNSNAAVAITPTGVISTLPPQAAPPPALQLIAVTSRKTHGGAGAFDVNIGLDGRGIEPRNASNGAYSLVFTFSNPLTAVVGASTSNGSGVIETATIGANPQEFIVNLTGVANAQTLNVSAIQLQDTFEQTSNGAAVAFSVLIGDVNGDRAVNSGDATATRNRSGQQTTSTNARADLNTDGAINSGDASIVRSRSGTAIGQSPTP